MGLNIILKQFLHGSVYNAHGELRWTVTDTGFMFEINGKEYKPEYSKVMEVDKSELRLGSSDAVSAFNAAIFKMIAVYCYKIAKNPELNALSGWDFFEQTDMLNALSGHISDKTDVSWQCYDDGIRILAGKEHILKYTELYLYKEDYWHEVYPDVPFSLCQVLICFAVMIKSLVAKRPAAAPEKKPEPAAAAAPQQAVQQPQGGGAPLQRTAPQQAAQQPQGGGVPVQRTAPQQAVQQPQGGGAPLQRTAPQQAVQQPQGGGAPLQRTAPQQAAQRPQGGGAPLQRTVPQQAAQQPQGGGVPLQRTAPQQAVQQPQGGGVPLQRTVPQQAVQQPQGGGVPLQRTAPQSVAVPKAPQQMPPQAIAPVTAPKNAAPAQTSKPAASPAQQVPEASSKPAVGNFSGADAELDQLSPLELQAIQDYFDEMCLEFKDVEKSVRKYYPAWALEDIKGLTGIEFIKAFIKKIS